MQYDNMGDAPMAVYEHPVFLKLSSALNSATPQCLMSFPVLSLFTGKKKKKKSISPKVQKNNSVWDQKSKLGPFWFSSTQSLSDLNGLGIVLIVHESEQSPAQQDEQEWERVKEYGAV